MPGRPAGVVGVAIVGGGLAGSLLALALRERGVAVTLIDASFDRAPDGAPCSATAISYGALPGWPLANTGLARLAAQASRHWRRLQRRHGELGWQPRALRLQGPNRALTAFSRLGLLPFSQVDTAVFAARIPELLLQAGVELLPARVRALSGDADGWRLELADGSVCTAPQVALAAGARCRQLWPALPERLRSSWASVLELGAFPCSQGAPAAWLPQAFTRLGLERRAGSLTRPEWVVDPGLVPWGSGGLLGQHTWMGADLALAPPPNSATCEQQLRQGLSGTAWAQEAGVVRQAPVAFCTSGGPLVGPVAQAPGLWLFTGFSAAFSQVPVLAPLLAAVMAADSAPARQQLKQLSVWPAGG
jgi:glycine/D-amino acid oxidase-like deaminating enzyme